jgi:glycosyltransferase involved in cell wall biosynthesis
MNVLLLEYDLYQSVGGGQTVYKRLIASHPGITFFYLGRKEAAGSERPSNARLVPFKEAYQVQDLTGEFTDLDLPMWAYADFLEASNIAASVAELTLDVADCPDYRTCGYLLGPALVRHGQKACRVALALHGNLSETQKVNWGPAATVDLSADQREQWQYGVADIRYGLSRDYLDHWQAVDGRAGSYLSPLRFLAPPKPGPWRRNRDGVSLNFIGRAEGCKGPDLFVELLTWLPRESYRLARLIGPGAVDANKVSSRDHLRRMAETRGLQVEQHGCMTAPEMAAVYAESGITVLPSRLDTLNLIAVESLHAGCPVAVSTKAGVCRFLRETYPGVPFTVLDVDRLYAAAPVLGRLVADYDRQRELLAVALSRLAPVVDGPTLAEIYEGGEGHDAFLRHRAFELYDRLAAFYRRHRTPASQPLTLVGSRTSDALRFHVKGPKAGDLDGETDLWTLYRALFYIPEGTAADLDKKAEFCARIASRTRVDRARIWSELARLERTRGNRLVAATYDVRVLRLTGGDRAGMLPLVLSDLRESGFPKEAETVAALYGSEAERLSRGRALLEAARTGHGKFTPEPLEFVEDGRSGPAPRVSIIVSLYRAADKLEAFLAMLAQHAWVADGRAELVFVDSASPTDEHAVFKRVAGPLGISAVYARSRSRETIQTAWNRGILLARAPYLSFLGVDETVRPECLPLLAGELDADPGLDWVQGSSVMTEVNRQGTPQRDVMFYKRVPYSQDLVYLDTCYLSWAGAMYRKTIHDRLGFYDGSFGAAGDTEFKNRVLPFIRTKTLPLTLGVFLNYPEERATQSPRAELEDLRAWYLHRSEAGVEYAMASRPSGDAWGLFRRTLGYRKSFCGHQSADLDFAAEIATFLSKRNPGPAFAPCAAAVERVRRAYRELDWLPVFSPRAAENEEKRVGEIAAAEARRVAEALGGGERVDWSIFNDNRHEQHANVWPAPALAGRQALDARAYWFRSRPADAILAAPVDQGAEPGIGSAPPGAADRLLAVLRQKNRDLLQEGKPEMAAEVAKVALYFQVLAEGKNPRADDASDAGSTLCAVLAESQLGRSWSRTARFDARFSALCAMLAGLARPISIELADALEGLALHADKELEKVRSMEVAARLLTCKSPAEAVVRHRADLSPKILETLQGAAKSAKAKGNSAYSERLFTYAAAVKSELATVAAG